MLELYNKARFALAEAHKVDELGAIIKQADILKHAAQVANDNEMIIQATELKLRAERRFGQVSKEIEKSKGGGVNKHNKDDRSTPLNSPTKKQQLAEAGVSQQMANTYEKVADIKEDDFEDILQTFRDEGEASRKKLLGSVKKKKRDDNINRQKIEIKESTPELTGKFDVLVLDPPWNYGREYDPDGSRVANPYPEMTQDELKQINIPANENSVMWLWTTHQFIWDAKELLEHWGFDYKATLVWDKENIGMGHWLRMQSEFCLLAVKGKPIWDNTTYRDIIREKRREHSRKPDSFYNMVDKICYGSKVDYFSREQREGWFSFGNDVNKF